MSDAQIGDLFQLQLSNRTDSGDIDTYYDYFLLKKSTSSSTYGLIEARKDVLDNWMSVFELHRHRPVAIFSQPFVLINYILNNFELDSDRLHIVCLLAARVFIALVNQKQVEKISEYAVSTDRGNIDSIVSTIDRYLAEQNSKTGYPTLIFDAIDCGIADKPAADVRVFRDIDQEKVPGENTFKWLRADYDFYQSVALA
jgi:hypothetical protein